MVVQTVSYILTEQDNHTPELDKPLVVFRVLLVPNDNPAEMLEPGDQALDLPAALVPLNVRSTKNEGEPTEGTRSIKQGLARCAMLTIAHCSAGTSLFLFLFNVVLSCFLPALSRQARKTGTVFNAITS